MRLLHHDLVCGVMLPVGMPPSKSTGEVKASSNRLSRSRPVSIGSINSTCGLMLLSSSLTTLQFLVDEELNMFSPS
ncbi:hypothetical protein MUK42_36696 [Musa troglodytarum]|uniref:Uncharacterized protein n=1 Tax=Musa troglodytarum TaxID=320322 RepID=A0A9E7GZU2_9LILI|nr:hypothetical protein MUK42_36696 [Musa troglodytarum]